MLTVAKNRKCNLLLSIALLGLWLLSTSLRCLADDAALYGAVGLDPYAMSVPQSDGGVTTASATMASSSHQWGFDLLPEGLIYRPYLAGPKESRTGIQFYSTDEDWKFDSSIGGQWGLLRIGSADPNFPKGWQLDFEASAQFRHTDFASQDILTTDIRFGLPLSFSRNNHQTKLALYFLRSSPSRELWKTIDAIRDNEYFERKALVLGHSIYLTDRFRVYGETGYAFETEVADKWEFQFGAECAPVCPTGILGAPFLAANVLLREEVDFGGTFTLQGGWAWRKRRGRLLRLGVHYANGMSNHFALHDQHEQQLGFGIWHDF